MKYKKLTLLVIFAACSLTYAQEVDYETAKNIASAFITVKKGNTQKSNLEISTQRTVYGNAETPLLYVFNFEGGGFVVVAANKNVEPVLAYAPAGEFSMEGENPAAESWLNVYAQGIAIAVETQAVPTSEMLSKWNNAEKGNFSSRTQKAAVVEPLLTSTWNQNRYYNALCPDTIVGSGYDDHTPNGCVALAMAQIMYYHRYPRSGYGSSYYVCAGYGPQGADYANANYNYDAMSDIATDYSNAIAQLCYHAGVSVRMNYKAEGSGALSQDAHKAFSSRFTYKATIGIHSRGSSDLSWINLLKTDLNRGLPVYYSACTGGSGVHACHAFVCDGYDEADYFHFNWGWGGSGNGWFTVNTMMGFLYDSEIITGIEPARETTISEGIDTLTATYGSFSDGSPARINYANNTDRSWLIAPQNGKNVAKITLKTAYFSTEKDNDILTVYSGDAADADSVIAVLSGSVNDTTIAVNSSQCFVTFTSNESTPDKGFKFTYTSTRISDNLCPISTPSAANCYEDPQGTITNNDEDDGFYEDENTCYWALKPAGATGKVGITFTTFDLAEGDFVELYTWNGISSLGNIKYWTNGKYRFTKENLPALHHEYAIADNGVFVRFRTDNNLNGTGFELKWRIGDDVGINEVQAGIEAMSVYPNPATDKVEIRIETASPESIQLTISDVLGRTVYTSQSAQPAQQYREEIDVSSLARGVYFLRIATSQGNTVRKVVLR
ncbi:MAG: C10 family peptidase [Lentimicrobiaceae bacterium]|nr:C10 family peptidase [Lentimicrobiaceae bacterium]